jgi:hypothetical protein
MLIIAGHTLACLRRSDSSAVTAHFLCYPANVDSHCAVRSALRPSDERGLRAVSSQGAETMTIILYELQPIRSARVRGTLLELGIPFETIEGVWA